MSVNDAPPRSDAPTASSPVARDRDEGEQHPQSSAEGPQDAELSRDQIFHLLQNERRREVLRYLKEADADRVPMRDIAESIAAAEHGTSVEALSSKQRQRVYVPLYQNHLPKLDAEGVLDYEQDRGFVERRPAATQLERHLWPSESAADEDAQDDVDVETDTSTTDSRWPLGAAGLGTFLFAGAAFDAPVLAALPDVAVSVLVLCLLVGVAVWQRYVVDETDGRAE